ncbi:hypothetical protein ABT034_08445 [Streptomyces sp. NPDC002773]
MLSMGAFLETVRFEEFAAGCRPNELQERTERHVRADPAMPKGWESASGP